ncbi:MAG: carboxylating nicotinate-nucleotide diphosphorylase [Candidatus Edwardsbacteria bacterium]|jgi:nicotinate-nucleotide pyrophosphorylase (carboxylating)|nr:carboxylating nicotinate-nucleotide diphosphorylase [Candidatus Edwardsbacteria bacterium]
MPIDLEQIKPLIAAALAEDIGGGDITSNATVPEAACGLALIMAKQEGVLAGIDVCRQVFLAVDAGLAIEARKADGDTLDLGEVVMTIQGRTRSILAAERTALNFLQRLSGIATATAVYVAEVEGLRARILDTRKTTPGLRALEKYAVACGGGRNHRMGLYDMVLVKDNHIEAAGGVTAAIALAREGTPDGTAIEVEVQNLAQLEQAIAAEPDVIMLDNMKPELMERACRMAWAAPARDRGRLRLEASGNVTLDTVRSVAECGVDFISVGALTHSAPAFDFSLQLKAVG